MVGANVDHDMHGRLGRDMNLLPSQLDVAVTWRQCRTGIKWTVLHG